MSEWNDLLPSVVGRPMAVREMSYRAPDGGDWGAGSLQSGLSAVAREAIKQKMEARQVEVKSRLNQFDSEMDGVVSDLNNKSGLDTKDNVDQLKTKYQEIKNKYMNGLPDDDQKQFQLFADNTYNARMGQVREHQQQQIRSASNTADKIGLENAEKLLTLNPNDDAAFDTAQSFFTSQLRRQGLGATREDYAEYLKKSNLAVPDDLATANIDELMKGADKRLAAAGDNDPKEKSEAQFSRSILAAIKARESMESDFIDQVQTDRIKSMIKAEKFNAGAESLNRVDPVNDNGYKYKMTPGAFNAIKQYFKVQNDRAYQQGEADKLINAFRAGFDPKKNFDDFESEFQEKVYDQIAKNYSGKDRDAIMRQADYSRDQLTRLYQGQFYHDENAFISAMQKLSPDDANKMLETELPNYSDRFGDLMKKQFRQIYPSYQKNEHAKNDMVALDATMSAIADGEGEYGGQMWGIKSVDDAVNYYLQKGGTLTESNRNAIKTYFENKDNRIDPKQVNAILKDTYQIKGGINQVPGLTQQLSFLLPPGQKVNDAWLRSNVAKLMVEPASREQHLFWMDWAGPDKTGKPIKDLINGKPERIYLTTDDLRKRFESTLDMMKKSGRVPSWMNSTINPTLLEHFARSIGFESDKNNNRWIPVMEGVK